MFRRCCSYLWICFIVTTLMVQMLPSLLFRSAIAADRGNFRLEIEVRNRPLGPELCVRIPERRSPDGTQDDCDVRFRQNQNRAVIELPRSVSDSDAMTNYTIELLERSDPTTSFSIKEQIQIRLPPLYLDQVLRVTFVIDAVNNTLNYCKGLNDISLPSGPPSPAASAPENAFRLYFLGRRLFSGLPQNSNEELRLCAVRQWFRGAYHLATNYHSWFSMDNSQDTLQDYIDILQDQRPTSNEARRQIVRTAFSNLNYDARNFAIELQNARLADWRLYRFTGIFMREGFPCQALLLIDYFRQQYPTITNDSAETEEVKRRLEADRQFLSNSSNRLTAQKILTDRSFADQRCAARSTSTPTPTAPPTTSPN